MALINLKSLTYIYPGRQTPALDMIDLQVEAGELVAIVGGNESGKSTLCLALSGLLPALFHGTISGTANICGMDTQQHTPGEFAGKVGLVLQNPANQLSGMRDTVYEEAAFGLENLGVPRAFMPVRIEQALAQVGLLDLRNRSPYQLSGGQMQRLAIASMLTLSPSVLILDEPTSMLDPQGRREVFNVLRTLAREGKTILVIEHHLEWIAQYANRVVALEQGRVILDGAPKEVLISEKIQQTGIGWLRYTQAASLGRSLGMWDSQRALPTTLEDAVLGFQHTTPKEQHHAD